MTPSPDPHSKDWIDEVLSDFADGIAAEESWIDAKAEIQAQIEKQVTAARIQELENIQKGGADGTWAGYGKAVQTHVDERIAALIRQEGGDE